MPYLTHRFGHRGAALIVLGVAWFAFAIAIAVMPTEQRSLVLYEYLPRWTQVAAWVVTGGVAVAYGLRGATAWDTPGMLALLVMPLVRCASFAFSGLIWWATTGINAFLDADLPVYGWHPGWYSAWFWVLVITLIRLVAGWPNPRILLAAPSQQALTKALGTRDDASQ